MRAQRLEVYELPEYRSKKNRTNDYGFDPHEQEHKTYTGMGEDINVHDQWAVESQGRIQDRTKEHLGPSDKAISAYRRLLKKSIDQVKKGERPVLAVGADEAPRLTGPLTIDGISATDRVPPTPPTPTAAAAKARPGRRWRRSRAAHFASLLDTLGTPWLAAASCNPCAQTSGIRGEKVLSA